MEYRDQIIKILEDARNEIKDNMSAARINASGRTSDSMRVEQDDKGFRLMGGTNGTHGVGDGSIYASDTAPIPTLEIGRAGGNVPKGFYYIIKEWSKEKGITFEKESERSTFAYFVAKKIAREGTARHVSPVDIYSTPVNKAVGLINDVLGKYVSSEIANALGSKSASVTTTDTHF